MSAALRSFGLNGSDVVIGSSCGGCSAGERADDGDDDCGVSDDGECDGDSMKTASVCALCVAARECALTVSVGGADIGDGLAAMNDCGARDSVTASC